MKRKSRNTKSKNEYITVEIDITDLVKAVLRQLKERTKAEEKGKDDEHKK